MPGWFLYRPLIWVPHISLVFCEMWDSTAAKPNDRFRVCARVPLKSAEMSAFLTSHCSNALYQGTALAPEVRL
jgi:hypothetical protein